MTDQAASRPPQGDGIARSVRLFRSFLTEQSDPDAFYSDIADDTVSLVSRHVDLRDALLLDVGGGSGYYTRAFRAAGARCAVLDADLAEMTAHGTADPASVLGDAGRLPVTAGRVDVAFSSNLLEHVRDPWRTADELARVVSPGGLLVLSYTIWLGPWGGHETAPWHYLGGERAARHYTRRHGRPPKNVYGISLFATSVADGLAWARSRPDFEPLDVRPRYLPGWSRPLLRVPVLRELAVWNLWMVLRRRWVPAGPPTR